MVLSMKVVFSILLLAFLASCDQGHSGQKDPNAPIQAAELYQKKCSICHGDDGKLAVAGAKDLTKSTLSVEEIDAQIAFGKGTMPPHKDVLTKEEIRAIAEFTLTLRK
jgi:mono/diheme cytochrome c family protein